MGEGSSLRRRPGDGAVVGPWGGRHRRARGHTWPLEGRGGRQALRGACRSGRGGGRGSRLLWLHGAPQPFPIGLASGAVGLRVFDRRRVALYADPEVDADVQGFLVGKPQLTGKLVDADFLGQLGGSVLSCRGAAQCSAYRAWRGLTFSHNARCPVHPQPHSTAKRTPTESPGTDRVLLPAGAAK